jgi:uncharacterized RmlC-like cupin family protein
MGSACSTSSSEGGDAETREYSIHRPDHSQLSDSARNFIAPVRTFAPKRDKKKLPENVESLQNSKSESTQNSPRSPQAKNGRRVVTHTVAKDSLGSGTSNLATTDVTPQARSDAEWKQAADLVATVVSNPLHPAAGLWLEEELCAAVGDDCTSLGGKDAVQMSAEPSPGLLVVTSVASPGPHGGDASPTSLMPPFESSMATKNGHSASRLRFVGSPSDSGVTSRSKGGGFNSNAEYSTVHLLDALAMDLISDRGPGGSATRQASASVQKRTRPKLASVLSVSSRDDDPDVDYPDLQDSAHRSRQLWIATGGTAGAHLQHHGVPGGILSDGIYIPAAYGQQGEREASLTMGAGRGEHYHRDEYLGNEGRTGEWSDEARDFEPPQQAPLDLML